MSHDTRLRLDHMVTQYVWALENEQVFMIKARHEVERSNFDQFRLLVQQYIRPVRKALDENRIGDLSPPEWSYLYMEMWARLRYGEGRNFPVMRESDEKDYAYHLDRLNKAGYKVTRQGVEPFDSGKLPDPRADVGEPSNPIEPIKENEMSNQITIVNKTLINGVDVTTMSDEQLIDAIKKVEKEIEELKQVKTQSKKIGAKIDDATKTLSTLVELLDNR